MLPTHELITTHKCYAIFQCKPGFEFTPMMLRKIASFIVSAQDGRFAIFAFAYSMLAPLDGEDGQEDRLLASALQDIYISGNPRKPRALGLLKATPVGAAGKPTASAVGT